MFLCLCLVMPIMWLQSNWLQGSNLITLKHNIMKTTVEIKKIAKEKAMRMQLGTYSRLKVNGEISDIVISPSSSGVYFYDVPGTIGSDILDKLIGFIYYGEL